MKTHALFLFGFLFMGAGCESVAVPDVVSYDAHPAGAIFETWIESEGIGSILVQVQLPQEARYDEGAPILIYVPTFFTPDTEGFQQIAGATDEGFIQMTLMYPGRSNGEGAASEGENDYGGVDSIQALRDLILFAHGDVSNSDGISFAEMIEMNPLTDNIGLYAFSHPGIAATRVLALYQDQLGFVDYFVGRENPTMDLFSCVELAYYEGKRSVINPLYTDSSYSSQTIHLDYESIRYEQGSGTVYFDLNGNEALDASDFPLGNKVPRLFGKNFYSDELLRALENNVEEWPTELATAEEAEEVWSIRETVDMYPLLEGSALKVMLVFGVKDHVQALPDKPAIHQAFDGFRAAGLWVRLNPDGSYVSAVSDLSYVEHLANTEPDEWSTVEAWGIPGGPGGVLVPLAAVEEMADRTQYEEWGDDLQNVL